MAIRIFETLLQLELMGMREPKFTDRKYRLLMKHQRGDAFAADYNAWKKEQMAEALARSTREAHRQVAVAKQHQKDAAKAAERTKWQADKDAAVAKQHQKDAAKAAERAEWQAGKDAALARAAANNARKAEEAKAKWETQNVTAGIRTKVKSGENHDSGGTPQTEFIIARRDGSGHDHLAINDRGETTSHTSRSEDK